MITIKCNNSTQKAVRFFNNMNCILVFAIESGEYWFTIGEYKTIAGAKKAAIKKMAKHGYTFNLEEMNKLKIK